MNEKLRVKLKRFTLLALVSSLSVNSVIGAEAGLSLYFNNGKILNSERLDTLGSLIKRLEADLNVSFIYKTNILSLPIDNLDKKIRLEDLSIELNKLMKNLGLSLRQISDKQFAIANIKEIESIQQELEISGKVISEEDNEELIGVSISVKNGPGKSSSNGSGAFKIKAKINDVLIFSYLGFYSQEVRIKDDRPLVVTMNPNANALEEVVVVGYGEQKRKFITGAISTIKNEVLIQSPAMNVSNTLMGRVTGLSSNMISGAPDRDRALIKVRGMGEALIVIDGVAREGQGLIGMELDKLDPNSIESITVLKDASAAVYGARGANGVILVTTKRGVSQRTSLNYSGNMGLQQVTRLPDFLNSYDYAVLNNEMYANDRAETGSSRRTLYSEEEIQKFLDGTDLDRYPNTNWYKEVLNSSAFTQKHNLALNGGGDKARFYINGSFSDQDGLFSTTNMKRYGFISNLDANVTKNTLVSVGVNYVNEGISNPSTHPESIFSMMSELSSVIPARYSNGFYNYAGYSGNPLTAILPEMGYNRNSRNVFTGSFKIKQELPFIIGLSATGVATIDRNNSFQKSFSVPHALYTLNHTTGEFTNQEAGRKPSLNQYFTQNNNVNLQLSLNYNKSFNAHQVSGLLLYEQNEFLAENMEASRSNYSISSLDQLFLGDANTQRNLGSSNENARQSLVGRLGYNYAGKYILEGTFRYDGSPYYPKGKRRAVFPSLSAAWLISEEGFIKDKYSFIDELKLRSSYGLLGNDGGSLYSYYYNYALLPAGYVFGTNNEINPLIRLANIRVPNTNITWEKVNSFDIGVDASLWKGLLGFEFDYYNKSKYDILRSRSYDVPSTFGIDPALENFAKERYYGFEGTLSHQNAIGNVRYTVRANMTINKSEVIDYGENDAVLPGNRAEGFPVGASKILKAVGIFKDQADVDSWPKYIKSPNGELITPKPGDIKYADLNKDGVVELYSGSYDRSYVAQYSYPPTIIGLSMGAEYGGFSFNAFLQASTKVSVNYTSASDLKNFHPLHLDRWTPENQDASYPRLLSNPDYNGLPSTFYVKNGNYLKLRTVELSYRFTDNMVNSLGLSSLSVNLQGQNLMTLSTIKRFDPESTGLSSAMYPPQKIFSFGVRVGI